MKRDYVFWKKVWGLLVFLDTFVDELGHVISSKLCGVDVDVVYLFRRDSPGYTCEYTELFPEWVGRVKYIGPTLLLFKISSLAQIHTINCGRTKLKQEDVILTYLQLLVITLSGLVLRISTVFCVMILATLITGVILPVHITLIASTLFFGLFCVYAKIAIHKAMYDKTDDGVTDLILAKRYLIGFLNYRASKEKDGSLAQRILSKAIQNLKQVEDIINT